jgi:hypothetical protein
MAEVAKGKGTSNALHATSTSSYPFQSIYPFLIIISDLKVRLYRDQPSHAIPLPAFPPTLRFASLLSKLSLIAFP